MLLTKSFVRLGLIHMENCVSYLDLWKFGKKLRFFLYDVEFRLFVFNVFLSKSFIGMNSSEWRWFWFRFSPVSLNRFVLMKIILNLLYLSSHEVCFHSFSKRWKVCVLFLHVLANLCWFLWFLEQQVMQVFGRWRFHRHLARLFRNRLNALQ